MWTPAATHCDDCIKLLAGRGMNICQEEWSLSTVMQPLTVHNKHKELLQFSQFYIFISASVVLSIIWNRIWGAYSGENK
jgi:hypothetical protein